MYVKRLFNFWIKVNCSTAVNRVLILITVDLYYFRLNKLLFKAFCFFSSKPVSDLN